MITAPKRVLYPQVTKQTKFKDMLKTDDRFEASDCVIHDNHIYVVFDNTYRIAKCDLALISCNLISNANAKTDENSQYEYIGYSSTLDKLIVGVEMDQQLRASELEAIHIEANTYIIDKHFPIENFSFPYFNLGFEGLPL